MCPQVWHDKKNWTRTCKASLHGVVSLTHVLSLCCETLTLSWYIFQLVYQKEWVGKAFSFFRKFYFFLFVLCVPEWNDHVWSARCAADLHRYGYQYVTNCAKGTLTGQWNTPWKLFLCDYVKMRLVASWENSGKPEAAKAWCGHACMMMYSSIFRTRCVPQIPRTQEAH